MFGSSTKLNPLHHPPSLELDSLKEENLVSLVDNDFIVYQKAFELGETVSENTPV